MRNQCWYRLRYLDNNFPIREEYRSQGRAGEGTGDSVGHPPSVELEVRTL